MDLTSTLYTLAGQPPVKNRLPTYVSVYSTAVGVPGHTGMAFLTFWHAVDNRMEDLTCSGTCRNAGLCLACRAVLGAGRCPDTSTSTTHLFSSSPWRHWDGYRPCEHFTMLELTAKSYVFYLMWIRLFFYVNNMIPTLFSTGLFIHRFIRRFIHRCIRRVVCKLFTGLSTSLFTSSPLKLTCDFWFGLNLV